MANKKPDSPEPQRSWVRKTGGPLALALTGALAFAPSAGREPPAEPNTGSEQKNGGAAPVIPPIDEPTITRAEVGAPPPPENPPVPVSPKRGYVLTVPIERMDEVQLFGGGTDPLQLQYPTVDAKGRKVTRIITDGAGGIELDAVDLVLTGKEIEPQFTVFQGTKLKTFIDARGRDREIFPAVKRGYHDWLTCTAVAEAYKATAKEIRDHGPLAEEKIAALRSNLVDTLIQRHTLPLREVSGYEKMIIEKGVDETVAQLREKANALTTEARTVEEASDDQLYELLKTKNRDSLQAHFKEQKLYTYAELLVNDISVDDVISRLRQDAMKQYKVNVPAQELMAAQMFYVAAEVEREWFSLRAQEYQDKGEIDKAKALLASGRVEYSRILMEQAEGIEARADSFSGKDSIALQRALEVEMNNIRNEGFSILAAAGRIQERIDHPADATFFDDKAKESEGWVRDALATARAAAAAGRPALIGGQGWALADNPQTQDDITVQTFVPSPERLINPATGPGRGKEEGK